MPLLGCEDHGDGPLELLLTVGAGAIVSFFLATGLVTALWLLGRKGAV